MASVNCFPVQGTSINYKYNLEPHTNVQTQKSLEYVISSTNPQNNVYTQELLNPGFSVVSAPVTETEEVRQARSEHLAAYNQVLQTIPITKEFNQVIPSVKTVIPQSLVPTNVGQQSVVKTILTPSLVPMNVQQPVGRSLVVGIPVYPEDTPETVELKLKHGAAHIDAINRLV